MNEKPTIEVGKVPIITKFIYTLGVLPTSYLMSMTYEEQLTWLCNYISQTLIPAINNDVEAIQELQGLYEDLRNYVNNYFDNLDVQEEINNKLDEMMEDGTLTTLIKNYVDPIINPIIEDVENLNTNFTNLQTSVNASISAQNTQIASITGGNPTVVDETSQMTSQSAVYVLSSNLHIYVYSVTDSDFIDTGIIYGESDSSITNNETLITASNYSSLLPDCDTATINKVYHLNFSGGSTSIPAHLPFSSFTGGVGLLKTYSISDGIKTGAIQTYENRAYKWYRIASGNNTWQNWYKMYAGANIYGEYIITQKTLLPNANNVGVNTTYLLSFSSGSTNITENLPITSFTGGVGILRTYGSSGTGVNQSLSAGCVQTYENRNNKWIRTYGTSWGAWYPQYYKNFKVTANDNIVEIWNIAKEIPGSTIEIEGEHNLITEFEAFYGNDFFTNFTASTNPKGIAPYNDMTIIGSSNNKILFNYTGDNEYVMSLFSPITSSIGSWTIDNLNIECSNCRYVIHDEMGGQSIRYKHTIKNCRFKIDNTQNTGWSARAVIGGGLGINGEIEITDNFMESYGDNSAERLYGILSYHNASSELAQSNLIIRGNYIANNDGIRLSYYGTSTKITHALISNNNCGHNIMLAPETPESTTINVEIKEWNNIIRN